METSKIRGKFLKYFESLGHTIVASDSLIPSSDPTLLFTSAGMVQFKDYFLGLKKDLTRAASVQKCLRTTDIEKVGYTFRHLTFFEMLGNFSFGDYFKKDAIFWSFEFLTKVMNLDKKRLYYTVYKEDDEAYEIWKSIVDEKRIYKLSEETNFWRMGDTGPCGPCSEILFDLGEEYSCGRPDCSPACDCDRFIEVWNLVFTQYDQQKDGKLIPLKQKNIDTGMGLERLSMVVNNLNSVFATDVFSPIRDELLRKIDIDNSNPSFSNYINIVLDHSRAITFITAEGILPSNEGRGYVLRKIIRRGVRYLKLLCNINEPFLYKLTPVVVEIMKSQYPELELHREKIAIITKTEEEKFLETLDNGMKILNEIIQSGKKIVSGEEIFKLYDTYGFPEELVREILNEHRIKYNHTEFLQAQQKAKEISRLSWQEIETMDTKIYTHFPETEFVGYEQNIVETKVLGIIKSGKIVDKALPSEKVEIVVATTPFYGESGGQVGDTGIIKNVSSKKEVGKIVDTKKIEDRIVHICELNSEINSGDNIILEIDYSRRLHIMRHHTATHLLHKILREVLGEHTVQSGSLVTDEYFRFDFIHYRALSEEEIQKINLLVNQKILECLPVNIEYTDLTTAKKLGAMALFEEKYKDKVRMVIIGDKRNPFSIELCGGTHCRTTGEIGTFLILSEFSIGANLRRIEAICGIKVYEYISKTRNRLNSIASLLSSTETEIETKISKLIVQNKKLQQEIKNLKLSSNTEVEQEVIKDLPVGEKLIIKSVKETNIEFLRTISDKLLEKYRNLSGYIIVLSILDNKLTFVSRVTKSALTKGVSAKKIGNIFKSMFNINFGGREDFIQGGGKIDREITIEKLIEEIKSKI